MLAVAMEDFTVQVVDIDTRTVVRRFPGHDSTITDFCFSSDSRWLVTVSLDSTARVWELPTGHCIDYLAFDRPATSVDLSPASDMMATSHVGDLGIYLWTNKSLYSPLTLRPLTDEAKPIPLSLPSHLLVEEKEALEEMKMEEGDDDEDSEFASPAQISNELITLANLPGSRYALFFFFDFSCDPLSMKVVEPVEPGRDQGEEQAKGSSKEAQSSAILPPNHPWLVHPV